MDNVRIPENERLQMEQIRELESEELQVEEVDDQSSDDNSSEHGDYRGFTFDPCLASLHTYLGEVEDTQGRLAFLEGGAILSLPMFYLEGVVLFPEATLPLTVLKQSFIAAVERALNRLDAPYMIGVVRVYRHLGDPRIHFSKIGTTAEIRQFRRLENSSLNVVTRGQQRFHLLRRWVDVDGVPWGEVQIIQEDMPHRIPKDAFGQLASVCNSVNCSHSTVVSSKVSCSKWKKHGDEEDAQELMSDASIDENDHLSTDVRMSQSSIDSSDCYRSIDESMSSDDNSGWSHRPHMIASNSERNMVGPSTAKGYVPGRQLIEGWKKACTTNESRWSHRAPRTFWPHWVYQMYDSYYLARRVAGMWRQIIGVPSMESLINKPDLLSFYIASKIPVSESTRQELLEINGVSYRLRREIQVLERFDLIRCKTCLTLIAKRSDMLVMSSDGPLNAYANPAGFVHEVMTVYSASGLSLIGSPVKEHSWFPGYAWTIADCAICGSNMGWLFTATKKKLQPKSFWGIRSSQVADELC